MIFQTEMGGWGERAVQARRGKACDLGKRDFVENSLVSTIVGPVFCSISNAQACCLTLSGHFTEH